MYKGSESPGAKGFLVALLIVILALPSMSLAASEPTHTLAGEWHGAIDIPGAPLGVILDIEVQDGALVATADIPAQGAFGLGLRVATELDVVRFEFVDIPAAIAGSVSEDGRHFQGTFEQAGMEFPFAAERRVSPESRASDAAAPAPDAAEDPSTQPAGTSEAAAAKSAVGLEGKWYGAIDIPGQPLEVILNIEVDPDGGYVSTADIPAQGARGLTLQVEASGTEIRLELVDIPATITGSVSEDGKRFRGVFAQAGLEFPFAAERRVSPESRAEDAAVVESLRAVVTRAMESWSVAGVALTVVKDGEILIAEGFGLRDVERNLPVTPHTLFGIGSSTKAFTTTAFQILVDEGALSWEEPIRKLIPGFRLSDPFASEQITALDFALHRSGLPRHDFPWMFHAALDLERLITVADQLEPSAEFRTTFQYNNFGFMVLGHLIQKVSGMTWQEFVRERILQPLGMHETTLSIAAMEASGDYAMSYRNVDGAFEVIPQRELGAAAAAGAINTNAVDMAQWLLLQLNHGQVDGVQLVSPLGLKRLHTPHMTLPDMDDQEILFTSYGLGWFIDSYRGHVRVHHGGNTLGYSADVAFLPKEGIGVAVLANDPSTPLPSLVINHVLDELLGLEPIDWIGRLRGLVQAYEEASHADLSEVGRRQGTTPSHDLQEYAGLYEHPAYGQIAITLTDDGLEATYYDATIPMEHWHYDQFQGKLSDLPVSIPFFFETNASGDIAHVRVGFEPAVEPIRFTRRADSDLLEEEYLSRFVGEYTYAGATFQVTLNHGALSLLVPGQPAYVLEPTRANEFVFRDYLGFAVHFEEDADGVVTRALLIQPQGNVELVRK